MVGTNDLGQAAEFYDAVLTPYAIEFYVTTLFDQRLLDVGVRDRAKAPLSPQQLDWPQLHPQFWLAQVASNPSLSSS